MEDPIFRSFSAVVNIGFNFQFTIRKSLVSDRSYRSEVKLIFYFKG